MSDLVARLRDPNTPWPKGDPCYEGLRNEAAAEIEASYAEINRLRSAIEEVLMEHADCMCQAARKRLGEALQGEEEKT